MTEAVRIAILLNGEGGEYGEVLRRALVSRGMDVETYTLHDCSAQEISGAVVGAEEKYGAIDVLAYCADDGSGLWNGMLLDIDEPEWDALMNRRLKGFFLACKYALPYLIGRERPCIVLITPERPPMETCGLHVYAADAACRAAAEHMAAELSGYGIAVEKIAPGEDEAWLGAILERCC